MTGRKGRGRGRGRKTAHEEYLLPRIPSGHPTGIRTRFPIRCVNRHSSTSNPLVSTHIQQQSTSMQIIDNKQAYFSPPPASDLEEKTMSISPPSAPLTYIQQQSPSSAANPQPSSDLVLHADVECATNFSPTHSHCFSGPASVNVTEIARKLQEDMEEDPEEEVESNLDPDFVYVNEYRVKIEHAPLVRALFERHGDIIHGSGIKSHAILSFLLEHLCGIVNKLKETEFLPVTVIELEEMLTEVEALEGQKMNVGWLRDRIERIIQTKLSFGKYMGLKEEKKKCGSNLKTLQQELDNEKAKFDGLEKAAAEMRAEIVDHMTAPSLAHGII